MQKEKRKKNTYRHFLKKKEKKKKKSEYEVEEISKEATVLLSHSMAFCILSNFYVTGDFLHYGREGDEGQKA